MVTRKVTACIVGSMLASTMVSGCTTISRGHASLLTQEVKSKAKSRPPLPGDPLPTDRTDQLTSPATKSRRPLGEFTMRAYTRTASIRGKTASGTVPTSGRTIAVDPRVIPLGTVIEIEGIGKRIAEDTGGHVKGKKLDVFLPTVQACLQFGVRSRKVYIVD